MPSWVTCPATSRAPFDAADLMPSKGEPRGGATLDMPSPKIDLEIFQSRRTKQQKEEDRKGPGSQRPASSAPGVASRLPGTTCRARHINKAECVAGRGKGEHHLPEVCSVSEETRHYQNGQRTRPYSGLRTRLSSRALPWGLGPWGRAVDWAGATRELWEVTKC